VGIFPGPVIVNVVSLDGKFIGFVVAMLLGMFAAKKRPKKTKT
jgi:hypothetical protein